MEEQDNIIDLGQLIEPTRVDFQFETPGWSMLLLMVSMVIMVFAVKAIRAYLKNAYRREALRLLANIENEFRQTKDVVCVNDTMILLKQVSLQTYARIEVADLHGAEWLRFLDSKSRNVAFLQFEQAILSALYKNEIGDIEDINGVFMHSKNWIKHHA